MRPGPLGRIFIDAGPVSSFRRDHVSLHHCLLFPRVGITRKG